MVQSFGRKRKSRKSKKVTVKKSTMYCIKRTKAGKRVVKVEVVQKGKKVVRKYASTKRALGKNVKCFRTKTQAKASLKQLKSSFGSGSKSIKKKTIRSYGYVACNDHENFDNGFKKFRVYKFYPIKYNYENYKIVIHKDKYSGEVKAFHVPQEAKTYRVKTSGSESERKASEKLAKARANKKARDYETLGAVGVELDLIECNPEQTAAVASAPGAPPGMKATNSFEQSLRGAGSHLPSLKNIRGIYATASQPLRARMNNEANNLLNGKVRLIGNTNKISEHLLGGRFPTHSNSGSIFALTGSNRPVRWNPNREDGNSLRNMNGTPYTGNGFGRSLFGRRVNYGFSKYF